MPGAIPQLTERVHSRLKRLPLYWKLHSKVWHARELPFDRKHGIDTSGIVPAEDLGHGDRLESRGHYRRQSLRGLPKHMRVYVHETELVKME